MKYDSNKGFTLIELLIVLAILGVLIALAVPKFANLASDRQVKVCQGNLRTLASSMAVYRIEEGVWPQLLTGLVDRDYIQAIPKCPSAGTYQLYDTSEAVNCTYTGHTLPTQ